MQIITYEAWPYFLLGASKTGFTFFTILYFLTKLFPFQLIKKELANINAAKNFLIAFVSITDIVWMAVVFYESSVNQSDYEFYVYEKRTFYFEVIYFTAAIIFWSISISFFWSKPRKSWLLTLIALLTIHIDFIADKVLHLWQDYLPSEWRTSFEEEWYYQLAEVFFFSLFAFFSYLFLAKRKKLPYDSAWIR